MAIGICLMLFYGVSRVRADQAHERGVASFQQVRAMQQLAAGTDARPATAADPAATDGFLATLPGPDMSTWSAKRIAQYDALRESIAADIPEGIVRIPAVDLQLPVFSGTREANLTRGAGRIEGTPRLGAGGNTGIAAHRDGYFRVLKDVKLGDEIEVETLSGVDRYQVTDLFVVEPEDVYILAPTEESTLTLVTCYPFYFVGSAPQRYIVRGTKL